MKRLVRERHWSTGKIPAQGNKKSENKNGSQNEELNPAEQLDRCVHLAPHLYSLVCSHPWLSHLELQQLNSCMRSRLLTWGTGCFSKIKKSQLHCKAAVLRTSIDLGRQ